MKPVIFICLALALAACGGAKISSADICNNMFAGDAKATKETRRDGIEPVDLCACLGATVDALKEDEKAAHLGVMKAVTAIRATDNVGVEGAAEKLEEQLRAGTGGHAFSEDAFEQTGRLLNDIGNQLEDGGACKV